MAMVIIIAMDYLGQARLCDMTFFFIVAQVLFTESAKTIRA